MPRRLPIPSRGQCPCRPGTAPDSPHLPHRQHSRPSGKCIMTTLSFFSATGGELTLVSQALSR
ncbi:hypothetical protein, partial [Cutibacterium acnes]